MRLYSVGELILVLVLVLYVAWCMTGVKPVPQVQRTLMCGILVVNVLWRLLTVCCTCAGPNRQNVGFMMLATWAN